MSENPTEQVQEDIHHHATHGGEHGHGEHGGMARWILYAACTAAVLAVLAAVAGSQATSHQNLSMQYQIKENDQWAFYQAKSLKNYVLESETTILGALGKQGTIKPEETADELAKITAKSKKNDDDKADIQKKAGEYQKGVEEHAEAQETFENGTMLFHISIAVLAIAVVAKRREFWFLSLVGGVVGIYFLTSGFVHSPALIPEEPAAAQTAPASGH